MDLTVIKKRGPGSRLCTVLFCIAFASQSIYGQSGRRVTESVLEGAPTGAGNIEAVEDVLRVRTDEVMVPVSVRDAEGKPVGGLTADRFLIYDEGERQKIASFNRARVPANIVLLLDASASVFHQMSFIRNAARSFIRGLMEGDRVCLLQFAERVELLQDWTSVGGARELEKALDWRYHPGDSTAFYDGLYLAAEEKLSAAQGRRIIIVLTDGIDTAERKRAGFADALSAVRRAEASVYVISLTASLREAVEKRVGGGLRRLLSGYDPKEVKKVLALIDEAEERLSALATETGGRLFLPRRDEDLEPAYRAVAEELRTQYIITYQPQKRASEGQWRRIRVLVLPGGFEVSAREGYKGRS